MVNATAECHCQTLKVHAATDFIQVYIQSSDSGINASSEYIQQDDMRDNDLQQQSKMTTPHDQ